MSYSKYVVISTSPVTDRHYTVRSTTDRLPVKQHLSETDNRRSRLNKYSRNSYRKAD